MLHKKLLLSILSAGAFCTANAQTARVQVIHNCADAVADSVDVYLNDTKLLDNFAFRTATPFIDAPAGSITLSVAPKTSTSVADAIYTVSPTLTSGATYIVVAQGIVSGSGYTPTQPFQLNVFAMGSESATSGSTDLLVAHGSTDAPAVDVRSGTSVLVDDIAYGTFSTDYLTLPTDDYTISITDASGSTTVASYAAPLETLGLSGEALVVLASGFLNPQANSDGPAFGLYAAQAEGGPLVRLPLSPRVQAIHNSPDAAADSVDVYLNGALLLNNFAFRTATPFIDAPYGPATIQIAPKTSTSVSDAIYTLNATLETDETYIVTAEGIVSPSGYAPAQPFKLNVFAAAREKSMMDGNTDVLVYHGSTDAPTVDVRAGTSVLVNDISFGSYNSTYLNLPTADYTIDVTDASGSTVVASYLAPLATADLENLAITVLASGFLNPAVNSDGPAFGLYAAIPSGGALIPLTAIPASINDVAANRTVAVYPNPASDILYINGTNGKGAVSVADMTGRILIKEKATTALSVKSLSPGTYMLIYSEGAKTVTSRFVKE